MVEGVVGVAEELLPRRPVVGRGVVLARHEAYVAVLKPRGDLLEFAQPLAALYTVIGRVREVSREDDEVGRRLERVHRRDGFGKRAARIRIHRRTVESPMRVGELHEVEVGFRAAAHRRAAGKARGEYGAAAEGGEVQELPAIERHGAPPWGDSCKTGPAVPIFLA